VSRSKPQERRTNGIQPAVSPLLGARRSAADPAFERLYRQHVHAVYRYALAVLQNEADAEDVAQTTFLNAYRAIQRGERPHTPHNWLIKIAHNVCRERFRASSRRPREVELDDSLAPAALADTDVPTAIEIRRALGVLAFNQRAALVMRELEGRSYAEIAQVLDVSVSAVETLMFRARRALREQLEGGLTCDEAEETLERLQSRELTSAERGSLRAHLRECKACATLERRQRAQRAALDHLGAVPLPASLASFVGGGAGGGAAGGGIGLGLGAKIAAVLVTGLVAAGAGHEALQAHATDNPSAVAKRTGVRHGPTQAQAAASATPLDRSSHSSSKPVPKNRRSARQARTQRAHGRPVPVPATPGSRAGNTLPAPPAVPPPPPLQVRLPVKPPPIQLPSLPVQVPQLPPPPPVQLPQLPLPPPPVQLPPLLPPPPPSP